MGTTPSGKFTKMTMAELLAALEQSLDDLRLSRGESQSLRAALLELGPDANRDVIRARAFDLARSRLNEATDHTVLDWLHGVVRVCSSEADPQSCPVTHIPDLEQAYFSPDDDCPAVIRALLRRVERSLDLCVFTITDDRLTDALLDVHRRGAAVRIITDNEKGLDEGSDVQRLIDAGVPLRMDASPFHMHHKYGIIDQSVVLTGSYNWTRSAARDNQENFIVSSNDRFVCGFQMNFDRLWNRLDG